MSGSWKVPLGNLATESALILETWYLGLWLFQMIHIAEHCWEWLLIALDLVAIVWAFSHVLIKQQDSRAAAFWSVIIFFVPLAGACFYALFGINRLRRAGKQYRESAIENKAAAIEAVPEDPHQGVPELVALRSLATALGKLSRLEFTLGNHIDILNSGDVAMPAMLDAIRASKKSVTICSYIFEAKGIGAKFVEELVAAKARGVEIRVMVDDAGTRYSFPPITRILMARGIKAKRFMPHRFILRILTMNLRNHRKIMVVDGTVGFTGGMNIRQGNMLSENPKNPVKDMHFRVQGPVVRQLQQAFAEDWAFCADEILQGDLWYPDISPAGEVAAIGIPDGPDEDLQVMPKTIFAAINAAQKEVRVMTPYFLPDPQIIWALNLATLRGVEVTIVTPRLNNIPPVRWAARTLYPSLLEKGVKIFEAEGPFDHSKFMTVDGLWSLIGSTNWDPRSLRLNFEFNLACFDDKLAQQLDADFAAKLANCKEVTIDELNASSLPTKLRDGVARMFIPIL